MNPPSPGEHFKKGEAESIYSNPKLMNELKFTW